MDRDTEKHVTSCHECQTVSQPSAPEPIVRKKFPDGPWEDLAVNLLGLLPSGDSILVVVEYYSWYFETAILKTTTTAHVADAQEDMFTTHGLLVTITSDNGPQFVSEEFRLFMNANNIQHIRTAPLWPQANGEAERQNRTLLKAIRIAHAQGQGWRKELRTFLLAY